MIFNEIGMSYSLKSVVKNYITIRKNEFKNLKISRVVLSPKKTTMFISDFDQLNDYTGSSEVIIFKVLASFYPFLK